ncbi:MAG: CoA pyrophosphatase [Aquimonas sp.]|nr:CoA pyrophosphatase [Aquimonas sp.]
MQLEPRIDWQASRCESREALLVRLRACLYPLHAPPAEPLLLPQDLLDLIPPRALLREAAVLVGLVERSNDFCVLLTRRSERMSQHAGQVAFPGGRCDPEDKGPLGAALREAHEEIALEPARVLPVGYIDSVPTFTGFLVTPVVALVDPDHRPVPNPSEVEHVFEVPLGFLLDARNVRIDRREWMGRLRSTYRYEWAGEQIWGATAAMLLNLRQRLTGESPPTA